MAYFYHYLYINNNFYNQKVMAYCFYTKRPFPVPPPCIINAIYNNIYCILKLVLNYEPRNSVGCWGESDARQTGTIDRRVLPVL